MTIRFGIALMIAWIPLCPLAADVIVNWGGNYVANDSQLLAGNSVLGSHAGDGYSGTPFDTDITQPFSPPISLNYSGTNARFLGGAILARQGNVGNVFENARIKNQGDNDSVQLKATQSGDAHRMHAAFFWDQVDFLTGNSSITIGAYSNISVRVGQASSETLSDASLRLLVRDGNGEMWLSGYEFTGLQNNQTYTWNTGNQGFNMNSDGLWGSYDPFKSLGSLGAGTDLHFDAVNTPFVVKNFSAITGVGFFFDQDNFHNNLEFHWEGFRFESVPEPSMVGAGSILGMLGLMRLRRRNWKNN